MFKTRIMNILLALKKNFFVQNYTYEHIYIKIRTFEHIIKW